MKRKKKTAIPDKCTNYEEEAEWFDKHDVSEFWDELEPVGVHFALKKPKKERMRLQKLKKNKITSPEKEAILKETAGMWKNREDMKDPVEWQRKTRAKLSSRYKISSFPGS